MMGHNVDMTFDDEGCSNNSHNIYVFLLLKYMKLVLRMTKKWSTTDSLVVALCCLVVYFQKLQQKLAHQTFVAIVNHI